MRRRPEQKSRRNKKKEKAEKKTKNKKQKREIWLSYHALEKFDRVQTKFKVKFKKCWKKRLHKHHSFFSYKELLFSLGNYVWDEKWPFFIIPSLTWKLSIVTPFEPDEVPSLSRPKITLHTGANSSRIMNDKYMVMRVKCEENGVPKCHAPTWRLTRGNHRVSLNGSQFPRTQPRIPKALRYHCSFENGDWKPNPEARLSNFFLLRKSIENSTEFR